MSKTIEHTWELELPAATAEQLLAALAARDRLLGQSITLEPEDDASRVVEVWLGTSEALEGTTYHLGVFAELEGPDEFLEPALEALEDIVAGQVEAAAEEAAEATALGARPVAEIEFRSVPEEEEKPQLVIPAWLAPREDDLPWGYLPFDVAGNVWPDEKDLEAHERIVLVPFGGELRLYVLPAIEDED